MNWTIIIAFVAGILVGRFLNKWGAERRMYRFGVDPHGTTPHVETRIYAKGVSDAFHAGDGKTKTFLRRDER